MSRVPLFFTTSTSCMMSLKSISNTSSEPLSTINTKFLNQRYYFIVDLLRNASLITFYICIFWFLTLSGRFYTVYIYLNVLYLFGMLKKLNNRPLRVRRRHYVLRAKCAFLIIASFKSYFVSKSEEKLVIFFLSF